MFRLLSVVALAGSLSAGTFCALECLSPGASNQALCAPLANQIQVDWAAGNLEISYHANNGTLIRMVETDSVTWLGTIYSNGDSESIAAPLPDWVRVTVSGVGGIGRDAQFFCDSCGASVPEPAYEILTGLVLVGLWSLGRR